MTDFNSKINLLDHLKLADWLVFSSTIFICLLLIRYGSQTKKTLASNKNPDNKSSLLEYLLMGRQLTLPLFIATMVATWYGNIFGVTQIAFEQGIYNLITQGFFWYITYIVFAIYLIKKLRKYNVLSIPELIKNIYGAKSAKLAAILVFFKTLPIPYAISIGLLLQCLLPLSLLQATSIGVGLIVLYTLSGGLRTIVYADVALFIIMCAGVICVLFFSIVNFGGLGFLKQSLPAHYFSCTGTHSIQATLVWLCIACSTTFISPAFYQRCLAAKSDKVAISGVLISTIIWFLFDLCTTFGAMYAKAIIPHADSLHSYLTYGIQLLPLGCKGLLLASVTASIIATLDSFLFLASNILLYDLPIIKLANFKLQSTIIIIMTAALTILMSTFFEGRIESSWLTLKSYFAACLFLPILIGYFKPSLATDKLFITNCIVSCTSITIWRIFFKQYAEIIDSFYIGSLASILVFTSHYLTANIKHKIIPAAKQLSAVTD
jgi:SSS family solute:Na+ symporter